VGIDDVHGYLQDGIEGWSKAGLALAELPQISAHNLSECLRACKQSVLDVRRRPEWQAGHIETSAWWPLDDYKASLPKLDPNAPIAVLCRLSQPDCLIACSLLQRAGFQNVTNVIGGFDAWEKARLPVVTEMPIAV